MAWYTARGRHDLPWRRTRDPYAVLVSEVMLQQTQVERVRPYYQRWLERWPTLADLAAADTADVIREWSGLGYNRRAVHLQRAAQAAIEVHEGQLPRLVDELRTLPGVGPYTAAAVASFAFEQDVAVVDTNIARALARVRFGVATAKQVTARAIGEEAEALLPADGVRDHNLALMDLGATVCVSRQPACEPCPVARSCNWRAVGRPEAPVYRRVPTPRFEETARFARGRIVKALRQSERGMPAPDLAALLPPRHAARIERYLGALAADGLVQQDGDRWRLPGSGK